MDLGADILHELRTPLHSIQGFVRLILEGKVPDPEKQRHFLAIVERESQRLNNLVDELLDAFATGSGPKAIKKECVSMRYVILDTIQKLGGLSAEKDITIDTDYWTGHIFTPGGTWRTVYATLELSYDHYWEGESLELDRYDDESWIQSPDPNGSTPCIVNSWE